MPKQIATFRARDVVVAVETDAEWSDEERLGSDVVGRRARIATATVDTLDEALEAVTPAFDAISTKIKAWSKTCAPDEIEARIGIKLTAEAGAVIARTSAEGNIEVAFRWSRNGSTQQSAGQE